MSAAAGVVETALAGERVALLPERALWWPRERTLVVADLHWGKDAAFAAGGVPLPPGTTADDLARLDRALARTGSARLILLGDLFHARSSRTPAVLSALAAWRARHADLDVLSIRGNHDCHAGDPPAALRFAVHDAPLPLGPFVLHHEPAGAGSGTAAGYGLAGHLHPVAVVRGTARLRARLPCFFLGATGAVLPAFSAFTGGLELRPSAGDRVYVVADDEVVPLVRV